jgi:hypothetical protein
MNPLGWPLLVAMSIVMDVRYTLGIGRARIAGLVLSALALTLAAQGCAHVAPYERERLAHSTMTTSDRARASEEHVRSVQEGAVGGGSSAGGGCGCN